LAIAKARLVSAAFPESSCGISHIFCETRTKPLSLNSSRARGDFREDSDWDVLILLEKPVNETLKRQLRDRVFDLELETDTVISTLIENKTDWADYAITPLFQNVAKEGVLV